MPNIETKKDIVDTGIACPMECGGKILRKKTRKGKIFFGCSNFPKCDFATWDEPLNRPCPECGRHFILRKHRIREKPYIYCSNTECSFKETVEEEKVWERKGTFLEKEED